MPVCFECEEIRGCKKGFYNPGCDGRNASKALAHFMKKYGREKLETALSCLHAEYDFKKLQEALDDDINLAISMLEKY